MPGKVSSTVSASDSSAASPTQVFAGTSGWSYPTWKPGFYPAGVSAKKFLGYYSSQLNSVEVNYTFRTLPTPKQLEGWLADVSPRTDFCFSFKAPQRITHFSRLRECDAQLAELIAALAPVAEAGRLGLILFQLPPNFKADLPRLETFLESPALSASRIAFEFRHESWFSPETYALLTRHNAALCIAEADTLTTPEVHTARTHTCFRLRRAGGYQPDEIAAFARRFATLARERDVYAYFKHEDEPTGALNAQAFLAALARDTQ